MVPGAVEAAEGAAAATGKRAAVAAAAAAAWPGTATQSSSTSPADSLDRTTSQAQCTRTCICLPAKYIPPRRTHRRP